MTKKFVTQAKNANKHTLHGLRLLEKSLQQDGWIGAQTAAADGEMIAGSARLEVAAEKFADVEPIVVESDGSRPVIVVRTDIQSADDPRAKRLSVADNQIARTDLDFDGTLLAEWAGEDEAIRALFADGEWEELTGEEKPVRDAEPQENRADELLAIWGCKSGDLWQLGDNRLLIGDCTERDNLARLLDGELIDIVFTSPPYNAGNSKTGAYHGGSANRTDFKDMYNDDFDDMSQADYEAFLLMVLGNISKHCREDAPILWNVCYNQKSRDSYGRVCFSENNPFRVKESIVWDKGLGMNVAGNHILSRTCEFIFLMSKSDEYYSNQNGGVYWNKWSISNRDGENMSIHGASFPIALPAQGIEQFSKAGAIAYEPFAGSGTTIIAATNLQRRCFAMEISEKSAAVILQRFADAFPALPIRRLDAGG
jgi:DNA modification methylase